jgi:hypothetical protein
MSDAPVTNIINIPEAPIARDEFVSLVKKIDDSTVALNQRQEAKDDEFAALVLKVDENTKVTLEVRDILITFNVLFRVAKWLAAIAAAGASIVAFYKTVRGL